MAPPGIRSTASDSAPAHVLHLAGWGAGRPLRLASASPSSGEDAGPARRATGGSPRSSHPRWSLARLAEVSDAHRFDLERGEGRATRRRPEGPPGGTWRARARGSGTALAGQVQVLDPLRLRVRGAHGYQREARAGGRRQEQNAPPTACRLPPTGFVLGNAVSLFQAEIGMSVGSFGPPAGARLRDRGFAALLGFGGTDRARVEDLEGGAGAAYASRQRGGHRQTPDSRRKTSFTIRSSSEWLPDTTASRPPPLARATAAARNRARATSSWLTSIRSA